MAKWTGQVYAGELLDWGFDWTAALPSGESISTATWEASPALVFTRQTLSDAVSVIWPTDFTAETTYTLTNEVTLTPSQRVFNQSITIYCLDAGSGGGVTVYDAATPEGDTLVWSDGTQWIFLE